MSVHLAPEVEAGLYAEAAARGVPVEKVISDALEAYRRQPDAGQPVRHVSLPPRRQEIAWTLHPDVRYVGQWVALEGDNVLAHGFDGKEVYEIAVASGIASPFMFFVPAQDPLPFVGGWLGNG